MQRLTVLVHHPEDTGLARRHKDDCADETTALLSTEALVNGTLPPELAGAKEVQLLVTPALADWLQAGPHEGSSRLWELRLGSPKAHVIPLDAGGVLPVASDNAPSKAGVRPQHAASALAGLEPPLPLSWSQTIYLNLAPARSRSTGKVPPALLVEPEQQWGGEVVFNALVRPASRADTTERVEVKTDDLVRLEWDDGACEWMTAADFQRVHGKGLETRAAPASSRGFVAAAIKSVFIERLSFEGLLDAIEETLGATARRWLKTRLAALAEDRVSVITDELARHVLVLLEDILAARRQASTREGGRALPPDSLERTIQARWAEPMAGRLCRVVDSPHGGHLEPVETHTNAQATERDGELLILIHGTLKPTEQEFEELLAGSNLATLRNRFGDRVFAFQHRAWSHSPVANAAALLEQLQACGLIGGAARPKVTLLSHSGGGQIGEILCGTADVGLLKQLLKRGGWGREEREAAQTVGALRSKLEVVRFIRCAAPVRGTSLVTSRFDRFFNALLGGLTSLVAATPVGAVGLPVLRVVRYLAGIALKTVRRPRAAPGLAALSPESALVYWLNQDQGPRSQAAEGTLYVVAAESHLRIKGALGVYFRHNMMVMLSTGVFGRRPNDGFVDTDAMFGGWRRGPGQHLQLRDTSGKCNHGTYLAHERTRAAVMAALVSPESAARHFEQFESGESRGYVGMLLTNSIQRAVPPVIPSSRQDTLGVVLMVPGIMGSHLAEGRVDAWDENNLWVDLGELWRGGAARLALPGQVDNPSELHPTGLVAGFYGRFAEHLGKRGYRVVAWPYDWRRSITDDLGPQLANRLRAVLDHDETRDKPVHLVGHSMGGLVIRAALGKQPGLWHQVRQRGGRVVQVATPNLGAPKLLAMLATGDHSVLHGLNRFAEKRRVNGVVDLRSVLCGMPGVLEMLPRGLPTDAWSEGDTPGRFAEGAPPDWFTPGWWDTFLGGRTVRYFAEDGTLVDARPAPAALAAAWTAVQALDSYESSHLTDTPDDEDTRVVTHPTACIYVAGWDDNTPVRVDEEGFISANDAGDGTVPHWSAGRVPDAYIKEAHDLVLTRKRDFDGVVDLMEGKPTSRLSRVGWSRGSRGQTEPSPAPWETTDTLLLPTPAELAALLAGKRPDSPAAAGLHQPSVRELAVRVTHGDVRHARWPVVVGHLAGDPLSGPERALDAVLGGRLTSLLAGGAYPVALGASLWLPSGGRDEPSVMLVGLGGPGELSPETLGTSLQRAFEQLAVFEVDGPRGVSCVLALGRGAIELRDAVVQTLNAAVVCNENLCQTEHYGLDEIEVLERYEDRALQARAALEFVGEATFGSRRGTSRISIQRHISTADGGLTNRAVPRLSTARPHTLRIRKSPGSEHLEFELASGRARAEREHHLVDWHMVQELVDSARIHSSPATLASRSLGHLLLHDLVPQSMRARMRVSLPLQLVLDRQAADIPWELMQDGESRPPATRFVLTRQLSVPRYRATMREAVLRQLLVIADVEGDAPLPGARSEARAVAALFDEEGWGVVSVVGHETTANEVRAQLTPPMGRALHIAAHGVLVNHPLHDAPISALALPGGRGPDGQPLRVLTAHDLAQLDPLPQVVFLNTCHSGRLASGDGVSGHGPAFAPDIATALISSGVRAVVVTGWEVDDQAASTFGLAFWHHLLRGEPLGDAALAARQATWRNHPEVDTFGAYQVYGDAGYQLPGTEAGKSHSLTGRIPVTAPAVVLGLAARAMVDLETDSDALAAELERLEAAIEPGWASAPGLALNMGRAWSSVRTGDATVRALIWLQHAASSQRDASFEAPELILELWNDLLWRAASSGTTESAWLAGLLRERADGNTEGTASTRDDHEPKGQTYRPAPDSFLHDNQTHPFVSLVQLFEQPPACTALGVTTPQRWRPRVAGLQAEVWTPVFAREAVRQVKNVLPTHRRARLIGDACLAAAYWMPRHKLCRKLSHMARSYYRSTVQAPGAEGLLAATMDLGLAVVVPPRPNAPDYGMSEEGYQQQRTELLSRAGRRTVYYWSQVAEVDLAFIEVIRQRDQTPDAQDKLADISARYTMLKQRFAADRRAVEQTGRTVVLLTRLAERLASLQQAEQATGDEPLAFAPRTGPLPVGPDAPVSDRAISRAAAKTWSRVAHKL